MTVLTDWLNRSQTTEDIIDPIRVRRLALTLGQAAPLEHQALPPLWHWAFFQPEAPANALGLDGHPAVGGFMPPTDGLQRMWAGGGFEFRQPLIVGMPATCRSHISGITEKQGRSGRLVFVTVEHHYHQHGKLAFIEQQNVVYRQPSPPKISAAMPEHRPQWQQTVQPDSTLLFRYSAITFNGHRIHYDHPYATNTEGYADLVVHGPMMATWALQACSQAHPDRQLKSYYYRGLRPSTLPDQIEVAGCRIDNNQAEVWLYNHSGLIQQGTVTFTAPHSTKA